jgi:cellulose synthase/poly-beta-1,6-N-acetylglucosamine synthase-like glycosyltransferase
MDINVRLNVIVPSYQRPEALAMCLKALSEQVFNNFQVLCVCRSGDLETREVVEEFSSQDDRFREVLVDDPGLAAALNAGLRAADAEFVTFTDDDAEAPAHWLKTIVEHFDRHPECGAVGGPDRLQLSDPSLANPLPAKCVGVYSWYGRYAATHHHPIVSPYLKCLFLKGVNMTFRLELIRGMTIGEGLRARTCTEPGIAARVHRAGQELHFVRDAWVRHYCAPRSASDDRTDMTTEHALNVTFNYAYVVSRYLPLCTALRAHLWVFVVGSQKRPGLIRALVSPSALSVSARHWAAGWSGALHGARDRRLPASDAHRHLDGVEAA